MTFNEYVLQMLFANGLVKSQAEAVLERAKNHKLLLPMKDRLNEECDGYPDSIKALVWISVKQVTLEWINESLPHAWFKPLFENKQ